MITATLQQIDSWRSIHQYCTDEAEPRTLDEARFVLDEHSAHDGGCLQFLAALNYASTPVHG